MVVDASGKKRAEHTSPRVQAHPSPEDNPPSNNRPILEEGARQTNRLILLEKKRPPFPTKTKLRDRTKPKLSRGETHKKRERKKEVGASATNECESTTRKPRLPNKNNKMKHNQERKRNARDETKRTSRLRINTTISCESTKDKC